MIILNKICTNEEYIQQGFTIEEVPLIREHDKLFNKYVLEGLTKEEYNRMCTLVEFLGL